MLKERAKDSFIQYEQQAELKRLLPNLSDCTGMTCSLSSRRLFDDVHQTILDLKPEPQPYANVLGNVTYWSFLQI